MQLDLRKYFVEACFFSLLWQIFAGVSIYLWNPAIFDHIFPDYFYSKLIAQELLFVAMFSILTFLIMRVLFLYVFYFSTKLGVVFSVLGYALIVTVYIFSWLQFLAFGKFINLASVELFVASPVQMMSHANDLVGLSIYRIALIPTILFVAVYVLRQYVMDKLSHKIILSVFLTLNVICAAINTFHIDRASYTKKYVKFNRTVISIADYMQRVEVGSASPLVTLKESVINRLLSDHVTQMEEGVQFRDIVPFAHMDSLLRRSDMHDWDVIIMEVESLRPLALSAMNENLREIIMPTVDAIAADSQVFTKAYAQSSHSSYADLVPLSSQYPLRSTSVYVYPEKIIYPKIMIYDVLSKYGYTTAIISSQNEEWQGMNNYLGSPNLDVFIHAGNYEKMMDQYGIKLDGINVYESKKLSEDPVVESFAGKISDRSTISIINSWVNTLNNNEHYFLYTNLQNSHFPYYLPTDRSPRFFKSKKEEKETRRELIEADDSNFKRSDIDKMQTLYNEALSSIDEEINRLVDHLKYLGRWENTLLVITADTSMRFSGSRIGNGGDLFEEVLHVPLVIKVPGKQATIDKRLMQHLDVTPTVLGYMGFKKHPGFQGKDFSDTNNCNSYAFAVAHSPVAYQYGVITDDDFMLTIDVNTKQVIMTALNDEADEMKMRARKDDLFRALKTWEAGQISYYTNEVLMSSKYPPIFEFNDSPCN